MLIVLLIYVFVRVHEFIHYTPLRGSIKQNGSPKEHKAAPVDGSDMSKLDCPT